jgi:hypothetical protein
MIFFCGMHDVYHIHHVRRAFVSVNRLDRRKADFEAHDWIMDSGAFTEISRHGRWITSVEDYALKIDRWRRCGNMLAAVAQDWMCEPSIIAKTGLSVAEHQDMTITRYDRLLQQTDALIMPVLQGYHPSDYIAHVRAYGSLLKLGAWVGVGSVCKRNTDPRVIEHILRLIKTERPDLRLHGFGLKITALRRQRIRALLHSADSMAWSFHAWKNGRSVHDYREAQAFVAKIEREQVDLSAFALH